MIETLVNKWYVRWIRPHIRQELNQQRLKLVWFIWGYWPILFISSLPFGKRLHLLKQFISIDWNILHWHRPCEIASIIKALGERLARSNEVMVEAGCYQGGSSAKFSLACKAFGYQLHIYDSFEGIEELAPQEKAESYDFSGEFAAPEPVVRANLLRYGEVELCVLHKGWFINTLAMNPIAYPVRIVYIDCDTAKGTYEVLKGVLPSLVDDSSIFSQDYHIRPVQRLLQQPDTWRQLGTSPPIITRLCGNLASLKFHKN